MYTKRSIVFYEKINNMVYETINYYCGLRADQLWLTKRSIVVYETINYGLRNHQLLFTKRSIVIYETINYGLQKR